MKSYSQFRPTAFDVRGLGIDERQEWLVLPCSQNRDSDALTRSNFRSAVKALGGESDTVEVHRFGHWGPGWFELILVDPACDKTVAIAESIEASLENYPVLDEEDFSQEEHEEANEVWRNCYREQERIEHIRKYRHHFEFHDFRDLIGCVRGQYYAGYTDDILR